MPREVANIAKTSSLKRVRSAVVKLQIARNSMTDVYTDTEYSVTMLAVLAEHRGFVIRKMLLKFGTGGLTMTFDEAIKHCLEVAEQNETAAITYKNCKEVKTNMYEKLTAEKAESDCRECAADHRQLAEWLTELKELREENKVLTSECDRLIKEKGELLNKVSGGDVLRICQLEEQLQAELDNSHCLEIELAEAKRLLKAAVEDIHKTYHHREECCDICKNKQTCTINCAFVWQREAEALALIGGESDD